MARRLLLLGLVCLIMVSGLVVLSAANGPGDGRINVGPYVGGLAIYCIDANGSAGGSAAGGIRVLSGSGQEVLFASGADLAALLDQAQNGSMAQNTLVASAPGPYGTGDVSLYVLTSGEYYLNGYDQHGSYFEFVWSGCESILPPRSRSNEAAPMSTEEPSPGLATSTPVP